MKKVKEQIHERIKVLESSNMATIAYDKKTKTLEVGFKNKKDGTIIYYCYRNVATQVYKKLLESPSPGSFLAHNIRDIYQFKKCEMPQDPSTIIWTTKK